MENLESLVIELLKLPTETTWLEFKHNNFDPDVIGQDISALANSAALHDKEKAYMIWGVDDKTHAVLGTTSNRYSKLKGNQEIESMLRLMLSANCEFDFNDLEIDGKKVVVLVIQRAQNQSVSFKKIEYIRVGSYTKKLADYPALQSQLWDKLRNTNFEESLVLKDLTISDVLNKLDFSTYFDLKGIPMPSTQESIIYYLNEEGITQLQDNKLYAITNMGALLFAKKLSDFPGLARKAVRIVQYKGNTKLEILKEFTSLKGYAVGNEAVINYLEALLPSQEEISGTVRKTKTVYPIIALREIIVNALIHQDFTISGAGTLIEVFDTKIEVTNPGLPIVDIKRIVDTPPRSRNDKTASLMRTLKMCEELGSGWDRIVISCELEQLPAPKIALYHEPENTKVTMFSERIFSNISHDEKVWSCYLHACIKYVKDETLTNASLRERFGIKQNSSASISRLIKDCVAEHLIKAVDENTAPRHMRYVPSWA